MRAARHSRDRDESEVDSEVIPTARVHREGHATGDRIPAPERSVPEILADMRADLDELARAGDASDRFFLTLAILWVTLVIVRKFICL
jgi:hypothetical protein